MHGRDSSAPRDAESVSETRDAESVSETMVRHTGVVSTNAAAHEASRRRATIRRRPTCRVWLVVLAMLASFAPLVGIADLPRAAGDSRVPLYDTAWDMPFWASQQQVDEYFDHLRSSGYAGVWLSLLNHTGGGLTGVSPELGTTQASFVGGQLTLQPAYRQRVTEILDKAHTRGLRVGLVPVWGHAYLHTNVGGSCTGVNAGPLQAGNAWEFGSEVGQAFARHPAIEHWILGGDNFCFPAENGSIWANLSAGLEWAGAWQPMTYHTAGWPGRHLLFADQGWVDFLSPQTSHCRTVDETRSQLQAVVNATTKPVFAAEMRYEAIEPGWQCNNHGPGNPVRPADIRADGQAALDANVTAIVYGHNERWQWGIGANGSSGGRWSSVKSSFGAGGEQQLLSLLGATGPSTPPPSTPPLGGSRIEVYALGTSGTERIELRVAGAVVSSFNLTQQVRPYTWTAPSLVAASDVQVAFVNDSPGRDAVVDAMVLDGVRYDSEAASTRSTGSWNGSCEPGFKRTETLHCNGFFHYDQNGSSASTSVQVVARGTSGTERVDVLLGDQRVTSFTLTTSFRTYAWQAPSGTTADQIKVAFVNDNGVERDVVVDAVLVGGQRFESEAATTFSTGTWNGSCAAGFKQSETLHCNGYFHYNQ